MACEKLLVQNTGYKADHPVLMASTKDEPARNEAPFKHTWAVTSSALPLARDATSMPLAVAAYNGV